MSAIPHMIDAVIDALFQPTGDHPAGSDVNRQFPRVPFRGRASAVVFPPPSTPHAEPIESEILTTDISRSGLSLLHRTELHPGQQVLLQLSGGSSTVEVCWCCEVWEGLFIAGCQFVDAAFTASAGTFAPGQG